MASVIFSAPLNIRRWVGTYSVVLRRRFRGWRSCGPEGSHARLKRKHLILLSMGCRDRIRTLPSTLPALLLIGNTSDLGSRATRTSPSLVNVIHTDYFRG